jgi:transposase
MASEFDAHKPATAFDHDSTLVLALETSGKAWDLGAVVPGVNRRPKRRFEARAVEALLSAIEGWKAEALRAGRTIARVALTYEAGRDGFWLARHLIGLGIEVHVLQPSSVPVERKRRRAKTDRLDLDILLAAFLRWLRGEPRACTMVRVPSIAEEDARLPGRSRAVVIDQRLAVENRMENLVCLHGIVGFKPRLKKAAEKLELLRTFAGEAVPPEMMAELRRLLAVHRLLSEQLVALDAARAAVVTKVDPDREERMIQLLAHIFGLGIETATELVREVLCRPFKTRRAIAAFVGLTGTPFRSGGMDREQGISKNGRPRVRSILQQLAWRWLRHQADSPLSRWFAERTGGEKGRIRKIMAVALARKLLVMLWRYAETGVIPDGVRLAAA